MGTEDVVYEFRRLGICKPVYGRQIPLVSLGCATAPHHTRRLPLRFRMHRPAYVQALCRSLLDETGAPLKVQQELMRHADIRTTMNVYGKAMDESKRTAHGKVVRLVLPLKVA